MPKVTNGTCVQCSKPITEDTLDEEPLCSACAKGIVGGASNEPPQTIPLDALEHYQAWKNLGLSDQSLRYLSRYLDSDSPQIMQTIADENETTIQNVHQIITRACKKIEEAGHKLPERPGAKVPKWEEIRQLSCCDFDDTKADHAKSSSVRKRKRFNDQKH